MKFISSDLSSCAFEIWRVGVSFRRDVIFVSCKKIFEILLENRRNKDFSGRIEDGKGEVTPFRNTMAVFHVPMQQVIIQRLWTADGYRFRLRTDKP